MKNIKILLLFVLAIFSIEVNAQQVLNETFSGTPGNFHISNNWGADSPNWIRTSGFGGVGIGPNPVTPNNQFLILPARWYEYITTFAPNTPNNWLSSNNLGLGSRVSSVAFNHTFLANTTYRISYRLRIRRAGAGPATPVGSPTTQDGSQRGFMDVFTANNLTSIPIGGGNDNPPLLNNTNSALIRTTGNTIALGSPDLWQTISFNITPNQNFSSLAFVPRMFGGPNPITGSNNGGYQAFGMQFDLDDVVVEKCEALNPSFTVSKCREGSNVNIGLFASQNNQNNVWKIYRAKSCTGGTSNSNMVGFDPANPTIEPPLAALENNTINGNGNSVTFKVPYGPCYIIKHGTWGGPCGFTWTEERQLISHTSIGAIVGDFGVSLPNYTGQTTYNLTTTFITQSGTSYTPPQGTHNYTRYKLENGKWVAKDYKSSNTSPYTVVFQNIPVDVTNSLANTNKIVHSVTFTINGKCTKSKDEEVPFSYGPGAVAAVLASTSCPTKLSSKVFLENVNPSTLLMDDYLRTESNFPLVSPYETENIFPRVNDLSSTSTTLSVIENGGNDAIVDWVFLELREDGENGEASVNFTRSALLQRDGDIVDMDGVSPVSFTNTPSNGLYYVSVRHRNHLGFRTENLVNISCATELNFTNNSVTLHGLVPVKQLLGTTFWTMNGGDANSDGSIDAQDAAIWNYQNGYFDDYSKYSDFNLDGSVDATDSALWEWNNGKYEELEY